MKSLFGLLSGLLFGVGLALSGMTDTEKVLGFLDVFGAWDMTLAFVMMGGLAVTFPAYQLAKKAGQPLFEAKFELPSRRDIDVPLVAGACIFGLGWGLYGYCPGPAIASLAYGSMDSLLFVLSMLAGMWLASLAGRLQEKGVANA